MFQAQVIHFMYLFCWAVVDTGGCSTSIGWMEAQAVCFSWRKYSLWQPYQVQLPQVESFSTGFFFPHTRRANWWMSMVSVRGFWVVVVVVHVCVCFMCWLHAGSMCSFDWSTIHTLLFFGRFCGMLSFQILPCICLNTQLRVRAMSPIYLLYVISDIHPKKMEAMQQMCRRSWTDIILILFLHFRSTWSFCEALGWREQSCG